MLGLAAMSVAVSACGSGPGQDANEPNGNFTVAIQSANWPLTQHLAQHTHLDITIRNTGGSTIPDLAVTITDPALTTSVQAFGTSIDSPSYSVLASHSRPVWVVDQGPGSSSSPCPAGSELGTAEAYDNNYSKCQGGPGGAVTAYSNTWAVGSVPAGESRTFSWELTAVKSGHFNIQYQVAAGLNGKARAVLQSGGTPQGTFHVTIDGTPEQSYVNNAGQVVIAK
jgi:hypothetical protein